MTAAPEIDGLDDLVEVGRGGFGVVFRARQAQLDRYVAVKLLTTQLRDERSQRRFEREGRVLGTLSGHPNVVGLYQFGITSDAVPYLVLEYLPDGSYADRIERAGPLPLDEATSLVIHVAGALESAHRLGIVHCDLKPENVLIGRLGEPKLGDFGISQVQGAGTATSSVLASPAHAAPEIIDGHPATPRSDIYGLGSTLYALLAGAPAFLRPEDSSMFAVLARIGSQPPPDLRDRGVPDAVWSVIYWSMAKDPEERPASALIMAQQLNAARTTIGLPEVAIPVRAEPPGDPSVVPVPVAATPTHAPDPTVAPVPTAATAIASTPPGPPGPVREAAPSERRSPWLVVGAVAVLIAAVVVVGALVARRGDDASTAGGAAATLSPATAGATGPAPTTGPVATRSNARASTDPRPQVIPTNGTAVDLPTEVTGYAPGQPKFTTLRVFAGETGGQVIEQFPSGMNGCAQFFWTLRWRSPTNEVSVVGFITSGSVTSTVGSAQTGPTPVDEAEAALPDASTAGYLSGSYCEQPAFLFGTAIDGSNLVDVAITYEVWTASA